MPREIHLYDCEAATGTAAFIHRFSALNATKEKTPHDGDVLSLVNLPRQFWNTFWPDFELLHDSLILLGVLDHELTSR